MVGRRDSVGDVVWVVKGGIIVNGFAVSVDVMVPMIWSVVIVDVHVGVGVVGNGKGRRRRRGGGHGGGDGGEEVGAIHGQRREFTRGNSVATDIVTANAERVFVTGARDGDSDLTIMGRD